MAGKLGVGRVKEITKPLVQVSSPPDHAAMRLGRYGKLPAIGVWALWGACFYGCVAYLMYGERGVRNRVGVPSCFLFCAEVDLCGCLALKIYYKSKCIRYLRFFCRCYDCLHHFFKWWQL